MSISKQYTKELRDNTNYSAIWLPTLTVQPGDVGRITNYEYEPVTTLTELNIPFSIVKGHVAADINYASANAVSIVVKTAGQAPLVGSLLAQAEAGVMIKFSRENAVVFRAAHCKSSSIKDRLSLENEIIARYKNGDWKEDYVVVTEVVSAASSTILISSGKNAQMDLKAGGKINPGGFNLADVDAQFQVIQESNVATKILAANGLTPLFKSAGIKKLFLRPGVVLRGPESLETIAFRDVDYEDFSPE
jgi:hypothetical protein